MLALSATYPESLAQQLTRYMREPTFVRLNPSDMGLKGEEVKPLLHLTSDDTTRQPGPVHIFCFGRLDMLPHMLSLPAPCQV